MNILRRAIALAARRAIAEPVTAAGTGDGDGAAAAPPLPEGGEDTPAADGAEARPATGRRPNGHAEP